MSGDNETKMERTSPFKLNKSHLMRMHAGFEKFWKNFPIGILSIGHFLMYAVVFQMPGILMVALSIFFILGFMVGAKANYVNLFCKEAKHDNDAFEEIK